jgi:hypothetical protein
MAVAVLAPVAKTVTTRAASMMESQPAKEHRGTVLVVNTGSQGGSISNDLDRATPQTCVDVSQDAALETLRADPFTVTAVVLSGEGGSPVITAILDAIKEVAPRIPIVFLDETESVHAELSVRRAGVHYYSHLPADCTEIASVLSVLAQQPQYAITHPVAGLPT